MSEMKTAAKGNAKTIKKCKFCTKDIRTDHMNRHFATHVDELFLCLDLKYISTAIAAKAPLLYNKRGDLVEYGFCLGCNTGCYEGMKGHDTKVWLHSHHLSGCSKHWSTFEARFSLAMNRQQMTEIEAPATPCDPSQIPTKTDGTELATVLAQLSTMKEELGWSTESTKYYEEETRKLRQMRSRLEEWYKKLDTKIIQIRRQLGDSEKDMAVDSALNEIGEVLDEWSLDTEDKEEEEEEQDKN